MSNEIKIEKGILMPIPNRTTASGTSLWDQMEIGDSIFFPRGGAEPRQFGASIAARAVARGRRLKRKFATRTIDGGTRVWRTA